LQKFKVYNYNYTESSFKLLCREEKCVGLFEVRGSEIKKIDEIRRRPDAKREEFIKYSGWVEAADGGLLYLITMSNDVEFYKEGS